MHDDEPPTDDGFDAVWDRLATPASEGQEASDGHAAVTEPHDHEAADDAQDVEVGPPIRVTFVVRADAVPVAPWAQGWSVGAIGPIEGHVTLLFEHDIDDAPVAQLAAITGLLQTIKQAKLDVKWWAMQTRGPLPIMLEGDGGSAGSIQPAGDGQASGGDDFDAQLSNFLLDPDA